MAYVKTIWKIRKVIFKPREDYSKIITGWITRQSNIRTKTQSSYGSFSTSL